MGGYEGADHVNSSGAETAVNVATGHWARLDEDYRLLESVGIRTIRESIGWRASVDRNGKLDTARIVAIAHCAMRHGLQVVWTIHHYGVPDGVDFLAPDFPERFADLCGEVARALDGLHDGPPVFQPINEISFLSWALAHSRLIHPYRDGDPWRAAEAKRSLVRATILGCDAIRAVDPTARIMHNDPVIHVIPTDPRDDAACREAERLQASQYEAWDMLCGARDPELGGHPRYLDVIGINYYHGNQWEVPSDERLHWATSDPRRRTLESLVGDVHRRYGRPIMIAETSHVGDGRTRWLDEVAAAALDCRASGMPLEGVCLYPLIDRPDWEDFTHWHRSGLWDVGHAHRSGEVTLERRLVAPYARRLRHWIDVFDEIQRSAESPPPAPLTSLPVADTPPSPGTDHQPCLIVFSHVRWDSVFQRPQQLMSRLAARFRIVFVEEPIHGAGWTTLERLQPLDGIEVLRPHVPGDAIGFDVDHVATVSSMLFDHLANERIDNYWLWFVTPMALAFAAELEPGGVVYDCMDELTSFLGAPPEMSEREARLLARADLVFTSGPGLFEAKRDRHADVHLFPNSVDATHFAIARSPSEHPLQAVLPKPRLGYAGVIDERIDLDLIATIADARPGWQIVMVGPVIKVDPASLPRRANLHWLGQRDHAELPLLMAGWDVGILPFALNEATRFINPTKTLEYLAAGLAVVSTPVTDVVSSYRDLVTIATTVDAFIAGCAASIDRSPEARRHDGNAFAARVATTSWDRTATAIGDLIVQTIAARRHDLRRRTP